jgi:predicted MFS family arabinose efflux permease
MSVRETQPSADSASRGRLMSSVVTVLALAGCGSGVSQRVMDPLMPRLSAEFGRPLSLVSWVITCFSLGYALSQLFFGPVGDRFGKLRVITWACGACSIASAGCALAPNLSTLLVARILAGAMSAALIPLAMAWIGDSVPYERRQPVLARFSVGQILGVALGQLLGGLSADYLGRRVPCVLLALVFAVSTLLLQRRRGQLEGSSPVRTHAKRASARMLLREFGLVLRERWARTVMLSVFLEGALVLGAFAFFATYLHAALHISLTLAGAAAMLFGLGGVAFALSSRALLQRFGELGLIRGGSVILVVAMTVVAAAPKIAFVAAACLAMGVGFYMLHNTLQTNATQMAPERRGVAVAAFALSYFLGQALGVSAAGWGVSRFGSQWVILVAAGGVLLTGLNFARLRRSRGHAH